MSFLGKQKSVYAWSLKFIPSLVHNQNLILFQSDHNEADVGTQHQNEKHRAERDVLPVSVGARNVLYVLIRVVTYINNATFNMKTKGAESPHYIKLSFYNWFCI